MLGNRAAVSAVTPRTVGRSVPRERVLAFPNQPGATGLMTSVGALLLVLAVLFAFFPRVLVYPLLVLFVWFGVALLFKSYKLHREGKREGRDRREHRLRRAAEQKIEPKRQ